MTTRAGAGTLTTMTAEPVRYDSQGIDLSSRLVTSSTVAASPAAAVETVIASITIADSLAVAAGVILHGFAAYTVGTNGVSGRLRIKQTGTAGTTEADTGVLAQTAAALQAITVDGFDTGPVLPGQVYVLTLIVASATAASTVSSVLLTATVV